MQSSSNSSWMLSQRRKHRGRIKRRMPSKSEQAKTPTSMSLTEMELFNTKKHSRCREMTDTRVGCGKAWWKMLPFTMIDQPSLTRMIWERNFNTDTIVFSRLQWFHLFNREKTWLIGSAQTKTSGWKTRTHQSRWRWNAPTTVACLSLLDQTIQLSRRSWDTLRDLCQMISEHRANCD